ncbi:MAG: glutathione-disulfide reductase [Hyphomicrobiales bacterium]|nr:MAG: glutathione-disulfide reductase [Hyphomicrobiales bacterium]
MSTFDYDLFVIGAGSGGVRAARMSAQYGARVAVAEEYRVGGTCVIRGCVPKKLFVYASQFAEAFEDAAGYGWQVPKPSFDWSALIETKDREIDRLNGIYIRNLKAAGVEIIPTRAELRDPNTIYLTGEDRVVTAATVLIATGAAPFLPTDVPGIEHAITSNEAFHLDVLPEHIAIVGGGYIAVEFAGIFNGLGVQTTLIYRGEEILRGFDDDLRRLLHEEMVKKGIDVRVMSDVASIGKSGDRLDIELKNGDMLHADSIMYATGRVPNVKGLGLSEAGVEMGWNGYVVVDEYNRSSVENIYAVGDVTHRVNLTPVAIREGAAFAETVFNDNPVIVDYSDIPTAVFSQPEIGTVGLTEALARERYPDLQVFREHFRPMKHTLTGRDEKILLKLLVSGDSGKVVGCHFMGPDAGELVQLAGVAMKAGVSKADFDRTIAVHPSAAEELVLMRTPQ